MSNKSRLIKSVLSIAAAACGFVGVVAESAVGAPVAVTAATQLVTAKTITGGKVAISGAAKVDSTLTAKVTGLTPNAGVTLKYQWLSNGKAISKATNKTYKVANPDVGKQLSVKVTVTKSGYTAKSLTSAQTGVVPPPPGSRENPYKVGQTAQIDKWSIKFTGTEAWTDGFNVIFDYRNDAKDDRDAYESNIVIDFVSADNHKYNCGGPSTGNIASGKSTKGYKNWCDGTSEIDGGLIAVKQGKTTTWFRP